MASNIETEDLTKTFGSLTAVDHLSFEVDEGEVFGPLVQTAWAKQPLFACSPVLFHDISEIAFKESCHANKFALQLPFKPSIISDQLKC